VLPLPEWHERRVAARSESSRLFGAQRAPARGEQVNVAWALRDEVAGFGDDSGGFICVPGSQKASYPIPRPLTTSIDLPQVYKPPMQAGDVLFFSTVTHGTTACRSDWDRRTTIQFMDSSNVALQPGKTAGDWRWSNDPNNSFNPLSSDSPPSTEES
jgi:hypothetical protein